MSVLSVRLASRCCARIVSNVLVHPHTEHTPSFGHCSHIAGCSGSPTVAHTARRFLSTSRKLDVSVLPEEDLKVTDKAFERLKDIIENGEFLRVEVEGGGCSGFEYKIKLDKKINADDLMREKDNVSVVVDQISLGYLKGATLDYVEDLMKASFRIVNNPVAEKGCSCGSSFAVKMD